MFSTIYLVLTLFPEKLSIQFGQIAMLWFWIVPVLVVIASIINLEKAFKAIDVTQDVVLAIRLQYPLWVLIVLDNMFDIGLLVGCYGLVIGVIAIRKIRKVLAALKDD